MRRYIDRRRACRLIGRGLAAALLLPAAACGTLLHPERRGQRGGRLDPAIVVLDAVGLLLFFIPGVIAFAVDFANGTIYLPQEEVILLPAAEAYTAARPIEAGKLRTVQVGAAPSQRQLEEALRRETNQLVRLDREDVKVARLEHIEQFGAEASRLAHLP